MTSTVVSKPQAVPWQLQAMRFGFRSLGNVMPGLAGRLALRLFSTPQRRLISARAARIMSQAKKVPIVHGASELTGYVWGEGPTILLVHGWESSASYLTDFVEPLLARGFQVVAFDAPAHGTSPGKQTNLVDFGRAIRAAVEQFGPIHGVVAHSFGGATTMFMLEENPSAPVGKLVVIASPANLNEAIERFTDFLAVPQPAVRTMHHLISHRLGQAVDTFSVEQATVWPTLPGLIIHDRHDEDVPFTDAEALSQHWPKATLQATTGLGHRRILRDPAVIKQTVDFLAAK
jgi:pimeloyl-ACP methyl ester carboxylesterase